MENIMQDLRDLRDNTPCLEEHSKCGCEKFDYIIDKIDDKQTHLKNLIDMVEDPKHSEDDTSEHYLSDGETLDIVIDQLKLIINKIK